MGDFARKRALRILPALCATLLFCVFIIGPLATRNVRAYFHNPQTYRYLAIMVSPRMEAADRLPGVFESNPDPDIVNGPLWTIRYEALCYAMVALFGVLAVYKRRSLVVAFCAATLFVHLLGEEGGRIIHLGLAHNLVMLLMFFSTGMAYYLYRERIPFSSGLFIFSIAGMVVADLLGCLLWVSPVLLPYALFYLAFNRRIPVQGFARYGDFSYGIYVYGCPIQQLLVYFFPVTFSAPTHFFASMAIILPCAAASWHYLEHPFLRLKSRPTREDRDLGIAVVSSAPAATPVAPAEV